MSKPAVTRVQTEADADGALTVEVTVIRLRDDFWYAGITPNVSDIPEDIREALREWLKEGTK